MSRYASTIVASVAVIFVTCGDATAQQNCQAPPAAQVILSQPTGGDDFPYFPPNLTATDDFQVVGSHVSREGGRSSGPNGQTYLELNVEFYNALDRESVRVEVYDKAGGCYGVNSIPSKQGVGGLYHSRSHAIHAVSSSGEEIWFRLNVAPPEGSGKDLYRFVFFKTKQFQFGFGAEPTTGGPSADNSIQQEIAKIRSGRNTPMPRAQATGANLGGQTGMVVENGTAFTLTVLLSGPMNQRIQLAAGSSQTVTLPPGNYEIAASVSSPNVVPFYGKETFGANTQYSEKFYIAGK